MMICGLIVLVLICCTGAAGCRDGAGSSASPIPGSPQPAPTLTVNTYGEEPMTVEGSEWRLQREADPFLTTVEQQEVLARKDRCLAAAMGHRLEFTLASSLPEPDHIQVDLWPMSALFPPSSAAREPAYSHSVIHYSVEEGTLSFSWGLPDLSFPQPGDQRCAVRVRVGWNGPGRRDGGEVRYYLCLQSGDTQLRARTRQAVRAFFSAAWNGDGDRVEDYLNPDEAPSRDGVQNESANPFVVRHQSDLPSILWQWDDYRFQLQSEPLVEEVRPVGKETRVTLTYRVQVTEAGRSGPYRCDFREAYTLCLADGRWRISEMYRSGTPWLAEGGRKPGWSVEREGYRNGSRIGPFYQVRAGQGHGERWSDDGSFLAFVADNADRRELWSVDRNGSQLRCLVSLQREGEHLAQDLYIVDWVPECHSVRFLVAGPQVAGPHRGRNGLWMGEADCLSGHVHDVAFIPVERLEDVLLGGAPRYHLTADRTTLMLWYGKRHEDPADLWRVHLPTGRVAHLLDDLVGFGDGWHFPLTYSPCGWKAVHRWNPVLYDLRGGKRIQLEIPLEPGQLYHISDWSAGGIAAVALVQEEDMVVGEYGSYPAGAVALRFYGGDGGSRGELVPPPTGSGDKILCWAWAPEGNRLAFITGSVHWIEQQDGPPGSTAARLLARGLWLWEGPGTEPACLASLDGLLSFSGGLSWPTDPGGESLQVWRPLPLESDLTGQEGLQVTLDGRVTGISRSIPYRGEIWEEQLDQFPGIRLIRKVDGDSWLIVARFDGGEEKVLMDQRHCSYFRLPGPQSGPPVLTFTVADGFLSRVGPDQQYLYLLPLQR